MKSQTPLTKILGISRKVSERSTEWAFSLFRPILKKLKVQKLKTVSHRVKITEDKKLIIAGIGKWVINVRRYPFPDGIKGLAEVIYYKPRKLFIFMLFVDESLYIDENDHELRVQRKMVAIHELVHGIAHMCLESFLKSDQYIMLMDKSIIAKVVRTSSDEFNQMISAIKEFGIKNGAKPEMFTDEHYRLFRRGYAQYADGFEGNYAELFTELMLSYQLIAETMTAFKYHYAETGTNISNILTLTANELIQKKALDKDFVIGRMRLFLPRLFDEYL